MSAGDDAACQWLDELPCLGPVTLNAFDRQLWESLLDANGNNNSRRSEPQHRDAEPIGVEVRRVRSSAYYQRQVSALRRANLAYRRLQTVVGRFRRSAERRDQPRRFSVSARLSQFSPTINGATHEEEPDSSAISQDPDRLACCRSRHPPQAGRHGPCPDDLTSSSSSWRSEISTRLFVPPSAVGGATSVRWQQQQLMETRCCTSLSHIGATHSPSQQRHSKQQPQTQQLQHEIQLPIECSSSESMLCGSRNSQVTMEFSADDSTFSYNESPAESLASPLEGGRGVRSSVATQVGAAAEQPRRPLLLPPAPVRTMSGLPADVVRALPTQRSRRQQQVVQQEQQLLQNQRGKNSRSCCIAVASQRLCPATDGRFAWAKSELGCTASSCSRACSQLLGAIDDFAQPAEMLLYPLRCSPIIEHVSQTTSLQQAAGVKAVTSVARLTLLVTSPDLQSAMRFVTAAALVPEPAEPAPSTAAPTFWRPSALAWTTGSQPQPPLYRWPPPPAGSLIGAPSNSISQASKTAASAGSSSSSGSREKLQQQRQLRRMVQVMQMRRKPSDTEYIVAPSGGDCCRSSSFRRRRCDLLEDLMRRRDEIDNLLTALRPSPCNSPTSSSRFYSFGGGGGSISGVEGRISSSASDSETNTSCSDDNRSLNSVCSSSSSSGGGSGLFFVTPDSVLYRTANNNADAGAADSHRRHRTYYARRCIVRLEESAALLIQEPACHASSVVAACAVHQDPSDSDSGLACCSSAVQPAVQALLLSQRLQALERRTLRRAWDRLPVAPSSLAALDPTVASFIWWSLIPLGRRLKPDPLSPLPPAARWTRSQTPCQAKTELEIWAESSDSIVSSSNTSIQVTSGVIGQQLIVNIPVSSQ